MRNFLMFPNEKLLKFQTNQHIDFNQHIKSSIIFNCLQNEILFENEI